MKITVEQQELFSTDYGSFDEMLAEYMADEERQGREVPFHALDPLSLAVALWLLETAAEKALDWVLETHVRTHEREMEEEARQRHEELCANYEAMKAILEKARILAREGDDIAKANTHLPLPGEPMLIELRSGAEEDLRNAFNQVQKGLPSLPISVTPPDKT